MNKKMDTERVYYPRLVLGRTAAEWPHPPETVLAELRAPVWWGALLTIIGAAYILAFPATQVTAA